MRSPMNILGAFGLLLGDATLSTGQEQDALSNSHRVYLRNGNVIEGQLVQLGDQEVQIDIAGGRVSIRRAQVDRVEMVTVQTRGATFSTEQLPRRANAKPEAPSDEPAAQTTADIPGVDDVLKGKVSRILWQLKTGVAVRKGELMKELVLLSSPGHAYLASLLESSDEDTSTWIGSALSEVKDGETLPYLIRALGAKRPTARVQALLVIAELGQKDSARRVRPLLSDEAAKVRATAIAVLRQLEDLHSLDGVLDLLKDPDSLVRIAAINAALEMGRKHNRMESVSGALIGALSFSDGEASKDLISAMGRTGRKELWSQLVAPLRGGDPVVRALAAAALASLASPESIDTLVNRLALEDDKRVRPELAAAARALGSFKSVEPFLNWLRSNDPEIVSIAAISLRTITRQEFGSDPERWRLWWEQARPVRER
jgi:HEAT repeat protein